MDLQFDRMVISCLQDMVNETQSQELTQEVKLNESMPDVGHVIGAWGQCILRSKEWNRGEICTTGGVMAWVLYAPEDGGVVQCVEAWLPIQMKCSFEDSGKDGSIHIRMMLQGIDARSTSARKLMIRANVDMECTAAVRQEVDVFLPSELPQDVQLLTREYPVLLPKEAGEKSFLIDEELTISNVGQQINKLIRYEIRPEIIDRKVIAGKAIFRGVAILHVIYTTEGGEICSWDFDIPFSQYTELDGIYDDAEVEFSFAVTNLDLEISDSGMLHLKAGVIGQYVIYGHEVLQIAEDAYSPVRTVCLHENELKLPFVLDNKWITLKIEQPFHIADSVIHDISFLPGKPSIRRGTENAQIEIPGLFQVLFYDQDGNIQIDTAKGALQYDMLIDCACEVSVSVLSTGKPYWAVGTDSASVSADVILNMHAKSDSGIRMLSGLSLGEISALHDTRPSMIIRRVGNDTLWEIAKQTGSTVDRIKKINQIDNETVPGKMLLIPVL